MPKKTSYTLKETMSLAGISNYHSLKEYIRRTGLNLKKNKSGYNIYMDTDVKKLELIKNLRERRVSYIDIIEDYLNPLLKLNNKEAKKSLNKMIKKVTGKNFEKRYTREEVLELTGMHSRDVLWTYVKRLGLEIKKDRVGYKIYTDKDIKTFRWIRSLRDKNISYEEIKDKYLDEIPEVIDDNKNDDNENDEGVQLNDLLEQMGLDVDEVEDEKNLINELTEVINESLNPIKNQLHSLKKQINYLSNKVSNLEFEKPVQVQQSSKKSPDDDITKKIHSMKESLSRQINLVINNKMTNILDSVEYSNTILTKKINFIEDKLKNHINSKYNELNIKINSIIKTVDDRDTRLLDDLKIYTSEVLNKYSKMSQLKKDSKNNKEKKLTKSNPKSILLTSAQIKFIADQIYKSKKITNETLSKKLGISKSVFSEYKRGKKEIKTKDSKKLLKIAKEYNIEIKS